ncbi:MAG: hypothetical protein IJF62_02935 [Firmicutes bacterium]|nr:hypothetical protein [Bacillota bacterium]MBQ3111340.1 hypothetical protein [Bacillota bacterium]MBQ6842375.1 hypothetical protein [Bacillota bacterium]MBR6824311.1 hypothetical protein [Bacillota bacterium]MBR7112921.1 hypothetical protein [Bacillota bacterium]
MGELLNRLSRAADLPEEILARLSQVVLLGDAILTAEGHLGVLRCEPQQVVFRSRSGLVQISGEGLCICRIDEQELEVRGQIAQVELLREGGNS